jgi:hypothetical protein
MGTQVWTIDATGQKYIDKDGIEHIIAANGAFSLSFTDDGVGGRFIGICGDASPVACSDGFHFRIEGDPRFEFTSSADGSVTLKNGEICFKEQSQVRTAWRVTALNMSNADGVGSDNVSSITLEQVDNPMRVITWSTINTA